MGNIATLRGVFLGGLSSGLISGAAMALFLMLYAWASGMGLFTPMQLIAGTFYGFNASALGAVSTIVGLIFHLFNAAVVGLVFGYFVKYSSWLIALIFGLVVAFLIWGTTTFVAVPLLDAPLNRAIPSMNVGWLVAHLIFGGVLTITPALISRFSVPVEDEARSHSEMRRAA